MGPTVDRHQIVHHDLSLETLCNQERIVAARVGNLRELAKQFEKVAERLLELNAVGGPIFQPNELGSHAFEENGDMLTFYSAAPLGSTTGDVLRLSLHGHLDSNSSQVSFELFTKQGILRTHEQTENFAVQLEKELDEWDPDFGVRCNAFCRVHADGYGEFRAIPSRESLSMTFEVDRQEEEVQVTFRVNNSSPGGMADPYTEYAISLDDGAVRIVIDDKDDSDLELPPIVGHATIMDLGTLMFAAQQILPRIERLMK